MVNKVTRKCIVGLLSLILISSCGVSKSLEDRPIISTYDQTIPQRKQINDSTYIFADNYLTKNSPTIRSDGCDRMTCSSCHRSYCYVCLSLQCICSRRPRPLPGREAVQNAGNAALNRVDNSTVQRDLTGIVDRLL